MFRADALVSETLHKLNQRLLTSFKYVNKYWLNFQYHIHKPISGGQFRGERGKRAGQLIKIRLAEVNLQDVGEVEWSTCKKKITNV